jgi:sirohydrochlorin cobaltochelatase
MDNEQSTHHSRPLERLLLIGHGSPRPEGNAEFLQFAQQLGAHLAVPVQPCFLELAEPSIEEGIRLCAQAGARHIAVLPLLLGPAGHQKNDIPVILNHARAHYPDVRLYYGTHIGAQYQLVEALEQRAAAAVAQSTSGIAKGDTALLLAARGSRDPDSNSEVYKLARLLWEGRDYGWCEVAFQSVTPPNVEQGIERCIRLGARRVVLLPYLLFTGFVRNDIEKKAQAMAGRYPEVEILVAEHLGQHPGVIAAVAQRYRDLAEGTATMTCDVCKYRHRFTGFEDEYAQPQTSHHHHEHEHGHEHEHHGHGHHH